MRDHITSILICLLQVAVGLGLSAFVSRLLPIADFGLYATFSAAILMLAVLAQAGLPDILLRETAAGDPSQGSALRALWRHGDLAALPSMGLAMIIGTVLAAEALGDRLTLPLAIALGVHIPLMTWLALRAGALRGLGMPNPAHMVMSVLPGSIAATLLGLILVSGRAPGLDLVMLANAFGLVVAVVICHCMAHRTVRSGDADPIDRGAMRVLRRAALPVAGIAGLGIFNAQSDVLMIGALDGTEASGLYQAALQLVLILTILRARSGMIAARSILHHFRAGDLDAVERAAVPAAISVSLFAFILFLVSVLAGGDILALTFGEEFRAAAPILVLASLSQLIAAATGMAGYLLILTGHQARTLRASIGSALINILLNPPLILAFGPTGAAISLFISVIFWAIYVWIEARRIGVDTSLLAWLRHRRADRVAAESASPAS